MIIKHSDLGWRLREASRVFVLIALISSIGIGVELWVFTLASSVILLTDLFHWAVDTVLEVIFLITLKLASRTRRKFPWSIIIVESSLTTISCIIILGVYFYLFTDYLVNILDSLSVSTLDYKPLVATITGGVLTLISYIILTRSYKQYRIELLRVDSIHALIDVFAAFMASLGVVLTIYTENIAVELLFTFILMLFVFHSMIEVFRNNIKALTGGYLDAELSMKIKNRLEEEMSRDISVVSIEARKIGSFYVVNTELAVSPDTTILELHRLRKKVIGVIREISELIYHVDVKFNPKYKWREKRNKKTLLSSKRYHRNGKMLN